MCNDRKINLHFKAKVNAPNNEGESVNMEECDGPGTEVSSRHIL